MITFNLLVMVVAVLWLLSLAAGLVAIWLGCLASPRCSKVALGCSVAGLAMAFAGLNWFHLSFTKTTNGSSFALDSKWFFLGTLGLALIALALAFWDAEVTPHRLGSCRETPLVLWLPPNPLHNQHAPPTFHR